MRVVKRSDDYWIVEIPETPDCGPYDTKAEATSDRIGRERFFRLQDKKGFVTIEK